MRSPRMRVAVAVIGAWLGMMSMPVIARGYCRTTSAPATAACPAPCSAGGVELAWGTPQIEYALHESAFAGLPDAEVRGALARSFAAWTDVTCSGQTVGFDIQQLTARTPLTVGPLSSEPNLNVISVLQPDAWQELGLDAHQFAKTELAFDTKSGEILGADIAFNAAIGTFAICPGSGCAADQIDIENVATHEIGHFLGLAHSADASSTMWCDAVKGDLSKRTLGDDDRAGLCAIYGSRAVFADPAPAPSVRPMPDSSSSGCALGAPSSLPPLTVVSLVLLASALRRRKAASREPTLQEHHA